MRIEMPRFELTMAAKSGEAPAWEAGAGGVEQTLLPHILSQSAPGGCTETSGKGNYKL